MLVLVVLGKATGLSRNSQANHSEPWSLLEKTITRLLHTLPTPVRICTRVFSSNKSSAREKVRMRILHDDGVDDGDVGDSGV